MPVWLILKVTLGVFLFLGSEYAHAASPRLARFVPGAVQRGEVTELVLEGERMDDPLDLHFYEPGLKVENIEHQEGVVRVRVRVAADCRIGEHVGHLRTRTGITEYRPLYVIPLPVEKEKEENNSEPQAIGLDAAYAGTLIRGDSDLYALDLTVGQRINVELLAMRLGNTGLDTVVTLLGPDGERLIESTGHPFSVGDPIFSYVVEKTGRHRLSVRELLDEGNEQSHYVLCVGTFPRPFVIFPPGASPDQSLSIQFRGDIGGDYQKDVVTPKNKSRHFSYAAGPDVTMAPTSIPFRLSHHQNLIESEPNNRAEDASACDLTQALCGTIGVPGDRDWYAFNAKKGESYDLEVFARRVRSPLDSALTVYDATGAVVMENDDGGTVTEHSDAEPRGSDSYLRFEPSSDGRYYLEVRDRLGSGSPLHVYRVECTKSKPWMIVRLPRVQDPNELYGQYRQQIFVARGNRYAALVRTRTRGFTGRMNLELESLPEGVTLETQTIPPGTTAFPVVFSAAEDAPLTGGLYEMTGRHEDPAKGIRGGYYHFADLLRTTPGNTLLKTRIVERVPIAVVDRLPYRLEAVPPSTPIVRNGEWSLRVRAIRDEGFDNEIRLTMPFLPPGISTSSGEVIPQGETEATFKLTAHPMITPRDWRIYVMGVSGEKKDWMWASTQIVPLNVRKGFAKVNVADATGLAGDQSLALATISSTEPFEGNARITLEGLPEGVTAEVAEFEYGDSKASIPIQIEASVSPGEYRGIKARISVPQEQEWVISLGNAIALSVAGGESNAAIAPDSDDPKLEVPQTRLERLRAAARKRGAAARGMP